MPAAATRPHPDSVDPGVEERLRDATIRVWIDQDLCTGDGLCEDLCPDVFVILEDGIAYVREGDTIMNDPGGLTGLARAAPHDEHAVIAAASTCPRPMRRSPSSCRPMSPQRGRGPH